MELQENTGENRLLKKRLDASKREAQELEERRKELKGMLNEGLDARKKADERAAALAKREAETRRQVQEFMDLYGAELAELNEKDDGKNGLFTPFHSEKLKFMEKKLKEADEVLQRINLAPHGKHLSAED